MYLKMKPGALSADHSTLPMLDFSFPAGLPMASLAEVAPVDQSWQLSSLYVTSMKGEIPLPALSPARVCLMFSVVRGTMEWVLACLLSFP